MKYVDEAKRRVPKFQYGWTLAEGKEFLRIFGHIFKKAGYSPKIIGSVAHRGKSAKDLDVLLTAITPNYDDQKLLDGFLSYDKHWADAHEYGETLCILLPYKDGNRVVEFFFDYPDDIVPGKQIKEKSMRARDLIEAEGAKAFIQRAADIRKGVKTAAKLAGIRVQSSWGIFAVDIASGKVLSRNLDITAVDREEYFDYVEVEHIVRFDLKEWLATRPGAVLEPGDTLDILDLGYWLKDGTYEPPEHGWRQQHRGPWRGQDQNDRANWGDQNWEWNGPEARQQGIPGER